MITSPLRYPGGKAKLYPFFNNLITENRLFGSAYYEPYAGGAGLAIQLLVNGFVRSISINDIDQSIYAFWQSALFSTDEFCELIHRTPVTVDEWHRQKKVWEQDDLENYLGLGFAAYFLNRTNRSGIIEGAGPVGGYAQSGKWKIDARVNKDRQIRNIKMLSKYAEQIKVSNLDALEFLEEPLNKENCLIYLDPPYYVKGRKLYKNFYEPEDHIGIAQKLSSHRNAKWVVSYDDVSEIRDAYSSFSPISYSLNYSAGKNSLGSEVIFFSDSLTVPIDRKFSRVA
jgi:DNA adenine methylase